ncbi:hypothetical protein LSTR_LSTR008289 [Laodelphax striatellus]|uniref:Ciliogenesis-associated TTC17-interacting protein N-terminal domain-containing protein n=1 Tax=Laodelphax striatellus TaxID=195883 RepID=A0A482XJG7_LAOST|nr:hypothetical protein LSTR_LSTR008289 [Laodelphax striatellus]
MSEENEINHFHRHKIPLKSLEIDPNTEILASICGRERLNVVDEKNCKVGVLKLSVSVQQERGRHQFVIHSSSSATDSSSKESNVPITKCGMSLTSRVTPNYETLEEFRSEYSIVGGARREKIFHLIKLKDEYSLSITDNMRDDDGVKNTLSIAPSTLKNYLSEGANILLLKYLAITRQVGRVKRNTMLLNGDICRSQLYVFRSGLSCQKVQTNTLTAVRTIKGHNGVVQKIYLWMNLKGQFLKQEWPNTGRPWRLEIDTDILPGTLSIPLQLCWQEDIQMKSIYMERMDNLKKLYRSYVLDYPEFKQILTDFILQVTLDKPDNMIGYAMEYFTSFEQSNG